MVKGRRNAIDEGGFRGRNQKVGELSQKGGKKNRIERYRRQDLSCV